MPRRSNINNPLQLRIQAVSLPKRMTPEKYLRRLIQAIDTGEALPRTWDVQLHWRNPGTRVGVTKRWRKDAFLDAIQESRAGFVDIVRGELVARLRRIKR